MIKKLWLLPLSLTLIITQTNHALADEIDLVIDDLIAFKEAQLSQITSKTDTSTPTNNEPKSQTKNLRKHNSSSSKSNPSHNRKTLNR